MKKLIIIEDNWMMAHMIEDVASLVGIDVIGIATSWEEALCLLTDKKPHFAVVDININGVMDGIKVAGQLREQNIDFMFLTAYKDLETIESATELSPLAYLVKPVTPENLMATLLLAMKKIDQKLPNKNASVYAVENEDLIYKGQVLTNLSKSERRILALLIKNLGYTVSYQALFYGTDSDTDSYNEATLRNVITKLRKKCPDLTIKNIKYIGYIAHE